MRLESGSDLPMLMRSARRSRLVKPRDDDNHWGIDAPYQATGAPGSYDRYFLPLLQEEGVSNFQGFLIKRRQSGLSTHVLDAFGSGLFLEEPQVADSITGVRLLDNSQKQIQSLEKKLTRPDLAPNYPRYLHAIDRLRTVTASPNWATVEGNLFAQSTWADLDKQNRERGVVLYDLIVAKPEMAFDHGYIFDKQDCEEWDIDSPETRIYSAKFLRMLNRGYTRLNPEGGMLAVDVPEFITFNYLDDFVRTVLLMETCTPLHQKIEGSGKDEEILNL